MRVRWLAIVVALGAICFPGPGVQAAGGTFKLDDLARMVRVEDAQISPDGKQIVVLVEHPDLKKDTYRGELVLVDVASGSRRTLTQDRDEVGSARWSPDGMQLAFTAPQGEGKDAKDQVWLLPMNGGEARPLTKAPNGVEEYAWRPDGKAIAYLTPDDPSWKKAAQSHHDLFVVGDNDFLAQKPPVSSHIWLQNLDGGKPQRLTHGSWSVVGNLSWSADGKYLAFDRLPDAYQGHFLHGRSAVLDMASRQISIIGNAWTGNPIFARRSNALAYFTGKNGSLAVQNQPMVADGPRAGVPFAADLDRDVQWMAWMPQPDALALSAADRLARALWIASRSGALRRIDLGDVEFGGGSVANDGAIAFTGSSARDPGELYYLAPGASSAKRLTDYNAWVAQLLLGESREFTWHNGGFEEDGVVTYPTGYVKGRRYPLALEIHGGPTQASSSAGFDPIAQELAAHGFVVLQPNYRGSDNLGFKYAEAMIGPRVYIGAGSDVAAGTRALEATGIIDTSRVGVSGWSGGGWMTSWMITNYPNMWKAAMSGAAVDDCVLQYSLEDVTDYLPALFGGLTPWSSEGMAAYRKNSPISYAGNVRAATLILSDTGDYRVPEPEAYEFYKALRDMHRTVEFVAIPAYGHFPRDPVRYIDTLKRWTGWLETHV
jgi:dipeptidyl aminopeptidase/acylaminoacyl peptidase